MAKKKEMEKAKEDMDPRLDSGEDDVPEDEKDIELEDRKKDYSGLKKIQEQMSEIYNFVVRGFEDKSDQNDTSQRAWDMYNCILNENQIYEGTSNIYVPLIRDAIEARVTRFSNQLFPQNGRYAEVVGSGDIPWDLMALLDYYVRATKLRSIVVPALLREGDCSGQYSLYVDWVEETRHTVKKVKKPEIESPTGVALMDGDTYDDREYEEIKDARPDVMVLDNRNLVVLPASVDEIDDAEIVAIALRLTKGRIKKYIRDGVFEKDAGEVLLENFDMQPGGSSQQPDTDKRALDYAGVKTDSKGGKRALVYKIWSKVKIKGEYRLMEMFIAGQDNYLSCKRIPFWSDRIPIISKPALKVPGSFWGKSPSEAVEKLQYQANDAVNIGMDSAPFSLLPVVMTDPEKNPRVSSMVMAQAAIWETNPKDTQILEIPPLWQQAMEIVALCKDQIMQSMGVNSAMMPNAAGGKNKKPSQAQAAQEQQVALESTNNVVNLLEEGILNELLRKFYEFDYQYRKNPLTLQKFGTMGLQADLQQVPIIEDNSNYMFCWNGTEANKSTQQVQQMIAAMNVLRGIPPQQMNGMQLDITPVLEQLASAAFGPRIAPRVLIDKRHQMAMTPELENQLMENAFPVHINPQDNDIEHIQSHTADMAMHPSPFIHQHIMEHVKQMQAKNMEAQGGGQKGAPQGQPGVPGGGAAPGVAGTPRMGAQPQAPQGAQNPPGAIHKDQMPLAPPRR